MSDLISWINRRQFLLEYSEMYSFQLIYYATEFYIIFHKIAHSLRSWSDFWNRLRGIREVDFHIKNNQNLWYDIRVNFISGKIHLSKVE